MATITEILGTDLAHKSDLLASHAGDLQTIDGLDNIKNALFHRLMTVPGTLAHRPTYGVGIGMFQNAPSSFAIQQKIAKLIEEQFLQDPRIEEVTSVSLTSQDDSRPELTVLAVTVKVVGYEETTVEFTPFSEGV